MEIAIVDDSRSMEEVDRVVNGFSDMMDGKISYGAWLDRVRFPRKKWLVFDEGAKGMDMFPKKKWLVFDEGAKGMDRRMPFMAVDNGTGECLVERFASLDGAMLYLTECHVTCERQGDWDYDGASRDRGGFSEKERAEHKGWFVIKAPVGLDMDGEFEFGYARAITPNGNPDIVFTRDIREAIRFDSREEAEIAADRLYPDSKLLVKKVVSVADETECKEDKNGQRIDKQRKA